MDNARLKFISKPFGGVVLLTVVHIAFPCVSLAQNQVKQPTTQIKTSPQRQAVPTTTQRKTTSQSQAIPATTNTQRQAAPSRAVPAATGIVDTNYTLGGGDRIRISVFEVPEYSGEYQIPPGGGINLPLIGTVSLLGLTTEQSAEIIAQRYSRFLKRPIISVNLISSRPINIVVAGEVTRQGAYSLSLQGGAGDNPGVQYPTVLSALTAAQGITQAADETRVQLRRKLGRGPEQVITVNVKEIRQTGRIPQDLTLRDGDTIFVPTATTIDLADARNASASSFAANPTTPRTVAVTGEVLRPGTYLITQGAAEGSGGTNGTPAITGLPTLTRALQLAGGITSQADIRNVVVRRSTRTGTEQNIKVDLWKLVESGDINQDLIVQDGDTVYFPTATEINRAEATQLATTTLSPSRIQVNVVGEVKRPGPIDIQPNSSLNQAILAAGGFNDARATRAKVDLVRLNPDGSVTKRLVKVDLTAGINEQTNPILRNNDVVLISRNGLAKTSDTINSVGGPLGTILSIIRFFGIGF
ncbi:polysaccharide export protein [Scytonema sp. HK-05]|uniref:SLBB domain-containing protein n=1 Tax=Scytonema sp. HK-05 TaxID=1137095 RepID=UPI00093801BC|nr:SLBB domain-containing protein [Scytonema sp. HK-05]OKH57195.1 polysaccharide export protein [Scytonema sp. HK-05]BAY46678.1 polysaccharide export protein [Scytonema sp. HK-05]